MIVIIEKHFKKINRFIISIATPRSKRKIALDQLNYRANLIDMLKRTFKLDQNVKKYNRSHKHKPGISKTEGQIMID